MVIPGPDPSPASPGVVRFPCNPANYPCERLQSPERSRTHALFPVRCSLVPPYREADREPEGTTKGPAAGPADLQGLLPDGKGEGTAGRHGPARSLRGVPAGASEVPGRPVHRLRALIDAGHRVR